MLEFRHVSCRYDDHFVLKDINVRIEDGDLVGVIGPNGSGKRPDQGRHQGNKARRRGGSLQRETPRHV